MLLHGFRALAPAYLGLVVLAVFTGGRGFALRAPAQAQAPVSPGGCTRPTDLIQPTEPHERVTVTYPSGWDLVGGPAGTVFPVPLFEWDPGRAGYASVNPQGGAVAGQGYWAYFPVPASVTLNSPTPSYVSPHGGEFSWLADPETSTSLDVPAGEWVQVANPSACRMAKVFKADAVYTYEPADHSYRATSILAPGRGAWVYLSAAGRVDLAVAIAGARCGTVEEQGATGANVAPGVVLNRVDAEQAEDCFFEAYQTCAGARLDVRITGDDTTQGHDFGLENRDGSCTPVDVEIMPIPQCIPVNPSLPSGACTVAPGAPASQTFYCAGLSRQDRSLIFSSCGDLGDIVVPGPMAEAGS